MPAKLKFFPIIEKLTPAPTAIWDNFSAQADVCHNSNGNIIKMVSQISGPCFPAFGEALIAQLAVSLAISLQIDCFILERNSLIVIMALQNPLIIQDWRISSLILDIIDSISASFSWEAQKINRSANICTYYATKSAATGFHTVRILIYPPPPPLSKLLVGKTHLPSIL